MITRDPNRLPGRATHPGEILLHEFLAPLGITQARFAAHLKTSVQRINEIVKGKRSVTAETAWLLSEALGTTPQFWINLQATYDLVTQRPTHHVKPIKRAS